MSIATKLAFLPLMARLKSYHRAELNGDILAGVIVAIMLIPQAMAYAMLAGLPPEIGLYASILPLMVYSFFGSSNFLSVGPVAITSLLVATTIAEVSNSGFTSDAIVIGLMLALMSGAILLGMGLARLGFLVNFISHPVIIGFISATAILIALSQLKHILGLSLPAETSGLALLPYAIKNSQEINLITLAIGLSSIVLLVLSSTPFEKLLIKLNTKPSLTTVLSKLGPVAVITLSTLIVSKYQLNDSKGVAITGHIPAGLPKIDFGSVNLDLSLFQQLLIPALIISLVGFVESISVAKTLASKRRQKVNANQELTALGLANISASISGACPVTGGFSRSAVNYAAGASSGIASIITAVFIAISLLFFTPWFYYLPKAVLAATIIVAIVKLIDVKGFVETWHYNKADVASLIVTFLVVLFEGIELGIVAGIILSICLYLLRTSTPHIAVVGRVGTSEHFRNVKHYKTELYPETLLIRVDESLYFANSRYLEDKLLAAIADQQNIKHIVLICSAINFIDSSALEALDNLISELRDAGVTFHLAEVKAPVMHQLQRGQLLETLSPGQVFMSTHDAVNALNKV